MLPLKLSLLLLTLLAPALGASAYEDVLQSVLDGISAKNIGEYIKKISAKPRNTGSKFIKEIGDGLKEDFKAYGLKVVTKKYKVMQVFPAEIDPSFADMLNSSGSIVQTFREDGDPSKGILPAFNAFSEVGSAEGKPLYVNYGREEDFQALEKKGIALKGCIGLARYGKIFRGDKAKLAKTYGLDGLIIYNDGADYAPGGSKTTYPDGPGLPYSGIQRGTLLSGFGDPSTYLYPSAAEYAYHETEDKIAPRLPGIVVMPISFDNALLVLNQMDGAEVPDDWQGGGTKPYRYGPGFTGSVIEKLRITVNTVRKVVEVEDIFGIIKGEREPDRWVMMGNHRDTWVQGAVDASTGLATMHEIARSLSPHLKSGWKPRRTLVLCSWGAEEQGIMGSTEFVEDYRAMIQERAVAYINVDCSATGNFTFSPAATPNFKPLLERVAKRIKANNPEYKSQYDQWYNSSGGKPVLKTLGSGSDYAAFVHIAGVSSIDLTMRGPYYTYHTQYDEFDYFSKYIDPGFGATKAVTQVAAQIFLDLACSKMIPLNAVSYSEKVLEMFQQMNEKLKAILKTQKISLDPLSKAINGFVKAAKLFEKRKDTVRTLNNKWLEVRRINDKIQQLERSFINPTGLPGRPHNRHTLFAPSATNSYRGAVFPGVEDCAELAQKSGKDDDWNEVRKQITIATWVTKAATRAISNQVFPK